MIRNLRVIQAEWPGRSSVVSEVYGNGARNYGGTLDAAGIYLYFLRINRLSRDLGKVHTLQLWARDPGSAVNLLASTFKAAYKENHLELTWEEVFLDTAVGLVRSWDVQAISPGSSQQRHQTGAALTIMGYITAST